MVPPPPNFLLKCTEWVSWILRVRVCQYNRLCRGIVPWCPLYPSYLFLTLYAAFKITDLHLYMIVPLVYIMCIYVCIYIHIYVSHCVYIFMQNHYFCMHRHV